MSKKEWISFLSVHVAQNTLPLQIMDGLVMFFAELVATGTCQINVVETDVHQDAVLSKTTAAAAKMTAVKTRRASLRLR